MNIFGRIFRKESKTARLLVTRGVGGQKWTDRHYETFAREAYMRNVIAFRCIFEIATSVASVGWELFEEDKDGNRKQIYDHWLNKIVNRANQRQSFSALINKSVAFLILSGDTFIERVALETGPNKGEIRELHAHRPDRMRLLTSNGILSGYGYSETGGEGITWDYDPITGKSDILHLHLFHPLDDYLGLSMVEPTGREIDTSNEAIAWNKSLLEQQGRPGMVFTIVGNLSEEQFDSLERQLEGRTGAEGAGKNIIIEGENGTKVQPYNFSPAEMDWLEGNRDTSRRICYGFGVPPVLMGIAGDSTYNNQREARQGCWDTTVMYYLNLYRAELNNWLTLPDSGLVLDYCLDDIPAMEYRREKRWERAEKSDFLTINEKRELAGYESYGPEGDVVLVQASMIPLGMSEPEVEELEEEPEDENEEPEE